MVLDDDPTGSQAATGVRVLLRPDSAATRRWLDSAEHALYVVTNTRSLSEAATVELLGDYVAELDRLCGGPARRPAIVLRGDSTLRGHVRAEIDTLSTPDSVAVFVPAYPDGGRVTIDGTHLLRTDSGPTPVAETEFARDPVFGYRDSYLPDWFAAHAPGRPVVTVPLASVRSDQTALAGVIGTAAPGTVVVPDAETNADVRAIVTAVQAAERPVVLRGSSTVAALRSGVLSTGYLSGPHRRAGRTLVVCGSHTGASTRQLTALRAERGVDGVELPSRTEMPIDVEVATVRDRLRAVLDRDGIAVLSTERVRPADLGSLADGAAMMRRLTAGVAAVAGELDACVVKGGISSAEVAGVSFAAVQARVTGQLEAGISWWRLRTGARELDYVVVPGNMGDDHALVRCVAAVAGPGR